jgi:hypothetical protein
MIGYLEYTANHRSAEFRIDSVKVAGKGFTVVASGTIGRRAIRAINGSSKVVLILKDGNRVPVFSTVVDTNQLWVDAVEQKANHLTVYQDIAFTN